MIDNSINNPNGVHGRLALDVNDTVIWNKQELVEFLAKHQGGVIDLEVAEGACLRSLGLFDLLDAFNFRSISIRTFNLIQEPHRDYKINCHNTAFRYLTVPLNLDYTSYHAWNGKQVFGAFYNRPTWSRLGLASRLYVNYNDKSLINFRADPHNNDQRAVFELDQLFTLDPQSIENFAKAYKNFPIRLENTDGYTVGGTTQSHTDQLSQFYPNFLVDVVAETFLKGRSFYPTEKTTRPMLMKKPFILMGSKCFLIHLRQMGFKTFHDFWDEDYDGHGMEQRYTRILDLIDSIAKKTPAELQSMYEQMQPILDHNYQLLIEQKFSRNITYVE